MGNAATGDGGAATGGRGATTGDGGAATGGRGAAARRFESAAAAFSVFLRFEITNFDVFLIFTHSVLFFLLVRVCCLCWITCAEQQRLTPAHDILFGN